MKGRVVFLLRFYLTTVIWFIVAKGVFMLCCGAGHSLTVGDALSVVWHGLTLDLSTALYFLVVPFLLTIASVWVKLPKWPFRVYKAIVAVAFALAFVADTSLYPFWGFKLDASWLGYLETPAEAAASVSAGYLLVRLLAVIAWSAVIFWSYRTYRSDRPDRSDRPRWPQVGETLLYLLLTPLMIIGIRGGLGESTTNIGQVYFSQKQFLNHSAVNPVFNFLAYLGSSVVEIPEFHFMDDAESERIAAELYDTKSVGSDTLLNTNRPNVVVILLESSGAIFTELEGCGHVMPHLSQLMNEGISFDSCFANSWRTDRGTVCTWSGYPSFPMSSVMKMPTKAHRLPGIAKSLAAEGYRTSYLYGGDINFTNMRSYLVSIGFEQLTWKADYTLTEQATAEWGVRDDITFKTLFDMVQEQSAAAKPFLIGYSTLSSHEPWDVPIHHFDDEELNAFFYLDLCIGDFVERVRQTPAWDNLLVVLLPDHGSAYKGLAETDITRNHIPMVWIGGAVKTPRRIATVCNQTDLVATLLGQMGINHDAYRFSRDVMSKSYQRSFAVHTYNNGLSVVGDSAFAVYDLNANRQIVSQGNYADSLMHIGQAVLQVAANDLKNMK